jgi:alpha-mannosidase
MDILQYAGIDAVELYFVIDWHEHEQMLKLEIPTALASPRIFAKVPGAALERKTNGEEEPYQDWIAIQGQIKGADYTLCLTNDGTYSYDCLDGLLRTVLIRSAPFARHNPTQVPHDDNNAWQDQGRQERRFWLLAGKGLYTAMNLDRRADELQTPAEYVMCSRHTGTEPWERSFFDVQPESVAVLALKRAERVPSGVIVRLQERAGKATDATIKSPLWQVNQSVSLKPWELKTVLIEQGTDKKASVKQVSLLET